MAYFSSSAISFTSLVANPARARNSEVTVQHIPGGSVMYFDMGGPLMPTLTLDVFFAASATYIDMEKLVGSSAMLFTTEGSWSNTILKSLTRKQVMPKGQTIATAEFMLTEYP